MEKSPSEFSPPKRAILWRGIRRRCPRCGEGKLFKGYIKQLDQCAHCAEKIGQIRADDGSSWLTILLTGHIVVPLMAYFALYSTLPDWLILTILIPIVLGMACLILPHAKGLFIAILWILKKGEKPL